MADLLDAMAGGTRSDEARDGRIFEVVGGIVTNNKDPQGCYRVRARIHGQDSTEESEWMAPMLPGGIEALPNVGDPVLVLFVHGDPNRPVYCATITTRTTGRPTEHMLLGDTFVRLYNDLVGKFNTLKGKYNQLQVDVAAIQLALAPATFKYQAGALTLTIAATSSQDADADAAKGKAADGSTPAALATSSIVLSADQKVR